MKNKIWILIIIVVAIMGGVILFEERSVQNARLIEVVGTNFSFSPSEIKVNKGEKIEIVFINNGTFQHDWMMDEFGVQMLPVAPGQTSTVIFTPDKTGVFAFYCNVDGHRDRGMTGDLVVQ